MKYAVVKINNKQYKVQEGDEVLVDGKASVKPILQVLALVDGDKVDIGRPVLDKPKVVLEKMGDEKGDKLYIYKYKSKSKYRRKMGFRASYSRYKVKSIS